jgi:DNA recombination protein RmuC
MTELVVFATAAVFLGVGLAIGRLQRQGAEAAGEQARINTLTGEVSRLKATLEAERRAAEERRLEVERTRAQVQAQVEKLAGALLEQKGEAMLVRSKEGLEALLKPLSEKLREFEQKVEKTYDTENRDRASLLRSLEVLQGTQEKLHQDAEALSRALTSSSKSQGDWGELVLERVLETAGLTAGREYEMQTSHTDEDGRQKRPDALVYLPGQRAIVVDAKCSLTAFTLAARASEDAAREQALDDHLASLRAHIRGLAGKRYTEVLQERTLDIVLLFVPSEAAFHAALSRDPSLYQEAFRQGVVVTSPTTLLAALQLVAHVWRSEKQSLNAQKIAEEAGRLLEKLGGFVADLDEVGSRLTQAQEAYAEARKKLETGRGNLLGRAKTIASLGARVKGEKVQALLATAEEGEEEDGQPRLGAGGEDGEAGG